MTELIRNSLISSAHDVSEGGLFCTLMESAISGSLGFSISFPESLRQDVFLFSESQSRVVISVSLENFKKVEELVNKQGFPFLRLGAVVKAPVSINGQDFDPLSVWTDLYINSLSRTIEP